MFERTVLRDGPRVISAHVPGARSVSIAAYVLAGSRLERPEQVGVAHFMEHITFQGTAAYPTTRALSEAIEGVGGSFNAATDRESTVYWTRVPARQAARGIEVLGELIARPVLDTGEIARERDVIVEEIRSYLDDPVEHVHMLIDRAVFGEGPLGREIAGDEAAVRALPDEAIRAFWDAAYRPTNTVVAIAGDITHAAATALVSSAFGTGNGRIAAYEVAPALPAGERYLRVERDTAQAQLCVGLPGLRRDHPDSWTLEVLNTILGDGMSSRLFLEVREERGLAYDVHSFLVDYSDVGAMVVYAGVDPDRLRPTLRAILRELAIVRDRLVPPHELAKAKAYISGRLELRMDETRHLSAWLGGQEALHDRVLTLDEALEKIAAVTSEGIREVARRLFVDDGLRLAVVTPPRHGRGLDRHLRLPGSR